MKEQGKSRIDRIVESAGTGLATQSTRRGFLGRMAGLAGASIFGGAVILGEKHEAAASTPPAGCFGINHTQVCYVGWRVTNSETGINGVYLRKGPSFSAPAVVNNGGDVRIGVGSYFCRVSQRGDAAVTCTDPGPRPSCSGWLYGYARNNPKGGWIPYSVGGVTYAVGDSSGTTCCGPAQKDYDCNRAKSACPEFNGCNGSAAPDVTLSTAYWDIANPNSSMPDYAEGDSHCDQGYYIRYAPGSVSHGWTHPGDKIKRYAYCGNCAEGFNWSCIEAWCCACLPRGCRGWVRSYVLNSTGSWSSCAGLGCCPPGQ